MNVIYKSDVAKRVSEVRYGQCFMKNGSIFMKAYNDFDYAVDLEDGRIYKLSTNEMNDQVFPIVAKVVVK